MSLRIHQSRLSSKSDNAVRTQGVQRTARSAARRPTPATTARGPEHSVYLAASAPSRTSADPLADFILNSCSPHQIEVVESLSDWAATELLTLLKPVEKCWQPQDYLPDPESPDFLDQVRDLRERAAGIPDTHLVTLVGDMVTEEALPTYMAMLNTLEVVRDPTGAAPTGWGKWTRAWTAEENRHGDLLNKYLWMTGKVNMKNVETTIQNLIGSGMDPKTENNPYLGFIYTSFQERATKVSHGNTAMHAKEHGDQKLATICGLIAADEGRHEVAYQRIVERLFERDPEGTMFGFEDMMRKQIVMPAHLMNDNYHREAHGRDLFDDFASVAEDVGVYTAQDYADIIDHCIKRWNIADLEVKGDAGASQEYVMKLPNRIRKLAERSATRKAKAPQREVSFSWLSGRSVMLR